MNAHDVPAVVTVTGFDLVVSRRCERCGRPVVLRDTGWWVHADPDGDVDDAD